MDERNHDPYAAAGRSRHVETEAGPGWLDAGPAAEQDAGEAPADSAADRDAGVAEEAERIAAERIAAEHERIRAQEAGRAHHLALHAASESLGRAIGGMIQASAVMTWSPGRLAEVDAIAAAAGRNLAIFRADLVAAAATGAAADAQADPSRSPHDELAHLYTAALDRMRETHRQMDALIALAEMDICNTPALIAMTRSIREAQALADVTNRGLGLVLDELGMAR